MAGVVQASMAFVAVDLPVRGTEEPCRTQPAPATTQCGLDKMYSSEWSRCTQPRATTLHIYWIAELYSSAVTYAYVLGRGAL